MIKFQIERQENDLVHATIEITDHHGVTRSQDFRLASTVDEEVIKREIGVFIRKNLMHEILLDVGFKPTTYHGKI